VVCALGEDSDRCLFVVVCIIAVAELRERCVAAVRANMHLLEQHITRGTKVSAAAGPDFELTHVMREVPSE